MKKLLIHSNNTSFSTTEIFPLSEQFVFDVDFDKDVDFYINDNLTTGSLKQKIENCDIVFIKVSLSKNYLEYLGLRLAYHIRLTKILGEKANIPIVIIAEESFQYLGLTYPEPSILFTKGIYLIKESLDDYQKTLKWFNDGRIKPLDDITSFVSSITIHPPVNYLSHHSIANEWALVRYFSMFEADNENELYISLQNKLLELDYFKTLNFKHLEAKANRQKFNHKKHSINPIIKGLENRKIGIIDDEIHKGWLEFYNYILNKSLAQSMPFNEFRKDESRIDLIARIQNWLLEIFESGDPIDLFIVDLRLHDDDFSDQDFEKLSGIKIIRFIKSKNPGIQIVVSTASNKVWNFQKCLEHGVKHFSIKESPETYSTRDETKASFVHFGKQIKSASERSFLAGLFRDIQNLKESSIFSNHPGEKEKEFKNLVFGKNGLLDQIFNLLVLDSSSEAIINQCLLIAFQILENYCDLGSVGIFDYKNSSGKVCQKDSSLIDVYNLSSDNKQILSKLELRRGKFIFQEGTCNETITSFEIHENSKLFSAYSGIDTTSLVKIICVFHFRHSISKHDIEKIIGLRYYRSNLAAHLTGCIKPDYKINSMDIFYFISIFRKIFI